MTTLEAINWLALVDFRLVKGGPWRYKLEVWENGKKYEIERDGPFGEVLPALVLGIRRLMEVKA